MTTKPLVAVARSIASVIMSRLVVHLVESTLSHPKQDTKFSRNAYAVTSEISIGVMDLKCRLYKDRQPLWTSLQSRNVPPGGQPRVPVDVTVVKVPI